MDKSINIKWTKTSEGWKSDCRQYRCYRSAFGNYWSVRGPGFHADCRALQSAKAHAEKARRKLLADLSDSFPGLGDEALEVLKYLDTYKHNLIVIHD